MTAPKIRRRRAGDALGAAPCRGRARISVSATGRSGDAATLKPPGQSSASASTAVSAAVDGKGPSTRRPACARASAGRASAGGGRDARPAPGRSRAASSTAISCGRQLGFPTANISLGDYLRAEARHLRGARRGGRRRPAGAGSTASPISAIGPTFGGEPSPVRSLLVRLFRRPVWSAPACGAAGFLRPELKFPGLDELKAQIAADCDQARAVPGAVSGTEPRPARAQ